MTLDPLAWPFLLVMAAFAGVVVILMPRNISVLLSVLRPRAIVSGDVARERVQRRARLAWLFSFSALLAGPVAPLLALFAIALGVSARRQFDPNAPADRSHLANANCGILNGITIIILAVALSLAVLLAAPAF